MKRTHFFSNRIDANHSWERTMVNEFLTQMEDFTGLLICTTNMRQLMDPAMQRRFHIMTEFKALNKSGIEKLFYNYFGSFKFTNRQTEVLEQYHSVTPGDIASLYGRIRFIPQAKINSEYIINELIKMQEEKK